jgi:hypothetical protein
MNNSQKIVLKEYYLNVVWVEIIYSKMFNAFNDITLILV